MYVHSDTHNLCTVSYVIILLALVGACFTRKRIVLSVNLLTHIHACVCIIFSTGASEFLPIHIRIQMLFTLIYVFVYIHSCIEFRKQADNIVRNPKVLKGKSLGISNEVYIEDN